MTTSFYLPFFVEHFSLSFHLSFFDTMKIEKSKLINEVTGRNA